MSTATKPKKRISLNGTTTKNAKKLTKKQEELSKIWQKAKGLFQEEFEKGLLEHPVRAWNNKKIICDTGAISRYLENNPQIIKIIETIIGVESIVITPINKIELLNWLSGYQYLDIAKRRIYTKFIKTIPRHRITSHLLGQNIDIVAHHLHRFGVFSNLWV